MNNIIYTLFSAIIIIFFILFYSCGDDSINAPQDFISGNVNYIDAQFNFSGGYYAVSLYGDSTNPFNHTPIHSDSVGVNTTNKTAYYKLTSLTTGSYYIASTWIRKSDGRITLLGSLGCNENPLCSAPTKVTVPNYAGTGGQDFRSKTH